MAPDKTLDLLEEAWMELCRHSVLKKEHGEEFPGGRIWCKGCQQYLRSQEEWDLSDRVNEHLIEKGKI